MTSDSVSQERVRNLLRSAFAEVPCPESFKAGGECETLSHEVAIELRRDFYNYEPVEIHYLLPLILEDLMDTRSGDDVENDDAERLILQLNPLAIDEAVVKKIKLEQFALFTNQQCEAICEWLLFARTWHDLRRFEDWVNAALDYWCSQRGSHM